MNINVSVPVLSVAVCRFFNYLEESKECKTFLATQDEADVVILESPTPDDVVKNYNPKQVLCILSIHGAYEESVSNICLLNRMELFGTAGVEKLLKWVRQHRTDRGKNPETGE